MEETVNMLVNYGATGVVLAYFIYKDNKTMVQLNETLSSLKETVLMLKERVSDD